MGAFPADSSGQKHGGLALSMHESEERMHSGLQHVIATGSVSKLQRET